MDSNRNAGATQLPVEPSSTKNDGLAVVRGGSIVLASTLMAQALTLLSTIWVARVLGPSNYGMLSLTMSVVFPLVALATAGLGVAVVRFIPEYLGRGERSRVGAILFSSMTLVVGISTVVTAILWGLAPILANRVFQDPILVSALRIGSIGIPAIATVQVAAAATRGLKTMRYDAIIRLIRPVLHLVSFGVLLWVSVKLLAAGLIATAISWWLTAFVSLFLCGYAFKRFPLVRSGYVFRMLIVYSAPLLLSNLMYAISPRIDRLVLGVVADATAIGLYSAAANVIVILKLLHVSLVKVFSPMVSDMYNRGSRTRAQRLYLAVTKWDTLLTFCAVASALLLAQEILLLFGDRYVEALIPFTVLAAGVYMGTVVGPSGAFLRMTNRQGLDAINAVVFLVVSPVLQFAFAYWLGWTGVAFGVVASAFVLNLVQVVEIRRSYGFQPFQGIYVRLVILTAVAILISGVVGLNSELPIRVLTLIAVLSIVLAYAYANLAPEEEAMLDLLASRTKRILMGNF